ncbi:HNH endonuclease [Proteus sp. fly-1089]|uniref:HNH endonuclease n=1 Tax=Proteus sp. fly-1089 TaxID=3136675 RepID=UPI0032DBB190
MIKLEKGNKPEYLTDDKVKELTDSFKMDKKKTVWKNDKISESLLKSSSFKCAYCECELQQEDSYMQVEHFKDKDTYPDDVVNWDNLLPSCSRCNRKKWTLDVVTYPIINPYIDNPKNHLRQQAFRLYGTDLKGKTTITKLFLNDDERIVYPRFLASNEISKQLTELMSLSENLDELRNGITRILLSCQKNKPYSAFVACALHSNQDYIFLKKTLEDNNLWDTDLVKLHHNSNALALYPR